ncbi:Variant SH3 domain-containing protein [Devosia limi DSM 17137]|uniref:Variant SH3 domain-containing protein n=1 Tax=Devosia limi DSM 17137 TaxID=1121477 RepID=A0A1M4V6T3_9HYPH|nr:Variant SH3 domain-containing protein [Devosia limi DSM 17137]
MHPFRQAFENRPAMLKPSRFNIALPEVEVLYFFPPDTFVLAACDYDRPYDEPISVSKGALVRPVTDGSMDTDFMGWTWCVGVDGRAGWTPNSWCEPSEGGWRLQRDFSALELSVKKGDRLRVIYSESGFLFCETASGDRAWLPDAVTALEVLADTRAPAA